jgi:hypothetical protein
MDKSLTCGAMGEGDDDIDVSDVGQLIALLAEALDVLSESIAHLLPTII